MPEKRTECLDGHGVFKHSCGGVLRIQMHVDLSMGMGPFKYAVSQQGFSCHEGACSGSCPDSIGGCYRFEFGKGLLGLRFNIERQTYVHNESIHMYMDLCIYIYIYTCRGAHIVRPLKNLGSVSQTQVQIHVLPFPAQIITKFGQVIQDPTTE